MNDSGPASTGIAADSLVVRYAARLPAVLEGTTLELPEGKITALIGPNGSGKSTLLKTLARQLIPESGRVLMNGQDLSSMRFPRSSPPTHARCPSNP